MPTSFDSDGKAAYVYNSANDTWYQVSGKTDISGTFEWTGLHTHLSNFTTAEASIAKKGTNNFLNPSARDSAIPSPTTGTICIIRQNAGGDTINEIQVYTGSSWTTVLPSPVGQINKFLKSNGTISTWEESPDVLAQVILMMGA
jgi:dipeptidyl aminopeptidase/acylaminoacyl peptidase